MVTAKNYHILSIIKQKYSLTVLEAKSPKFVLWGQNQGISSASLLETPGKLPCLLQLLTSTNILRLCLHDSNLRILHHTAFPSSVCVNSPSVSLL